MPPQTLAVPPGYDASDLLSDQFLFEDHQYISDAFKPPIVFTNGSRCKMDIVYGHKVMRVQPINPDILPPDFPEVILQPTESHSPPAYINRRVGTDEYFDTKPLGNTKAFGNLAQYRGNTKTPTALTSP